MALWYGKWQHSLTCNTHVYPQVEIRKTVTHFLSSSDTRRFRISFVKYAREKILWQFWPSSRKLKPRRDHVLEGLIAAVCERNSNGGVLLALPAWCADQGLCICRASIYLSICPIQRPHVAAARLLLCALRAEDIARLLHGRRQMRAVPRYQLT